MGRWSCHRWGDVVVAQQPAAQRLANLLLAHIRMYGVPVEDGVGFRHRLNQSELAQSLGVARRSVTRIITEWREEGIVDQRGHALVVLDLAKLTALSSPDVVGLDWSANRLGHELAQQAGRSLRPK
jgi:hypothetical protein